MAGVRKLGATKRETGSSKPDEAGSSGAAETMELSATHPVAMARPQRFEPVRSPIDHAHLARYTFGNRELEREVLGLFAEQAPTTLNWLKTSTTPKSWRDAAHTLKGSARAVGAFEVATAAEAAEGLSQCPSEADKTEAVARLERALETVRDYICRLDRA